MLLIFKKSNINLVPMSTGGPFYKKLRVVAKVNMCNFWRRGWMYFGNDGIHICSICVSVNLIFWTPQCIIFWYSKAIA